MTSPSPSSSLVYSSPVQDTTTSENPVTAIRKSTINSLFVTTELRFDGYDLDNSQLNLRTVYCVYAMNSANIAVRVSEHDNLIDANDYIKNDEGGFFS